MSSIYTMNMYSIAVSFKKDTAMCYIFIVYRLDPC